MRNVGIVIDSTFGVTEDYAKKNKIGIVPLKVIIADEEFQDGKMDPDKIIEAFHNKQTITTSQPTPEQFIEAINKQLETYKEVICMTLSKTLSGTLNSATLAATIIDKPNVYVVDSETTISGGSYLTEKLIAFLDKGHTASEALDELKALQEKGYLIFTVNDLHTLHKNGRLGLISTFIGNILRIKPILRFKQGVLELEHKVRGVSRAMEYLVNETKKLLSLGKQVIVRISYVDRSVEAKQVEHAIYKLGEKVSVKIAGIISPVVSAHIGLGGLGIYLAYE